MSEYEFFEGPHDGSDLVPSFDGGPDGGLDGGLFSLDFDHSAYGEHHHEVAAEPDYSEPGFDADLDDVVPADHHGVLLDLDFDLGLDNLDLADLPDLSFDASYDTIGSHPDEAGWWNQLASDFNHDAAYDEVSHDDLADPYVTN